MLVVSVFIGVHRWPIAVAFAASSPTPSADSAFDTAAKGLDRAKEEVQKLKNDWDRTRLETTLYDQRAKRAYKRWAKATKKAREKAQAQKEAAQGELQLAVEKRKLAYNLWQASVLRAAARESELKALDQEKDARAVREKIKQLEGKISRQSAVDGRQPSGTPPAARN